MDVTTPEAAEVASVVEVRLPEATRGMAEGKASDVGDWAAAPQPAHFFLPFAYILIHR